MEVEVQIDKKAYGWQKYPSCNFRIWNPKLALNSALLVSI